jgi:Co/Zn/Cd efflux system component
MGTGEKLYSIFALIFMIAVIAVLLHFPELRQLRTLLPISFAGLVVNIIFMFILLKDAMSRKFKRPEMKIIWVIAILLLVPVLLYLPLIGFRDRTKPV